MATGQNIRASDYNAIRSKVEQILDTGGTVGRTRGYGQPLISEEVVPELDIITRDQWEALRRDIINIKIHQENPKDSGGNVVLPFVIPIPIDQPVRFGSSHPNTNFDNLIEELTATRLQIAEGRSLVSSVPESPKLRNISWSTKVACEITADFGGYTRPDGIVVSPIDHARYFFNSGGKIRISSSRAGGSPTAQNNAWTALLVQAGIRYLSANEPASVNFYSLTNTYQTLFDIASSGVYSANTYTIEVKGDDFDVATQIPAKVIFRITWEDAYADISPEAPPFDLVDGTLSLFVEESKAAGPIFDSVADEVPEGAWNMPSPSFSITDIFDA